MAVSKRGNKWQARVNEPNVKYHRYSFTTEAAAIQWERAARAAVAKGITVDIPTDSNGDLPLTAYFEKVANQLWERPQKPRQGIAAVARAAGDVPMSSIDQDYVETFIERSRGEYSPLTINIRLSMLKMVYRQAKKKGDTIEVIEFERLSEKDCVGRLKFLDDTEEQKLIEGFNSLPRPDFLHAFNFMLDTGCRPHEIFHNNAKHPPIGWSNISRSAGGTFEDITDPATGRARAVVAFGRGKTGANSMRVIPLTQRALDALLYFKDIDCDRPFGTIQLDRFRKLLHAIKIDQNLDDEIVPYTLRHTCASRLVQRGASIFKVMKWMGHTKIETTMIYAKLRQSDVFELSDLL